MAAATLSCMSYAATPGGSAGNDAVTTDSPDGGGKMVTTGSFVVDNSVGGVVGISSDSSGKFVVRHGYIGQLYEAAPVIVSTITATPPTAAVNQTITFSSLGADVDPVVYAWDFGDGAKDTTNKASVTHAYTTAGTFTVTLTITDLENQVTTTTLAVVITAASGGGGGTPPPPGFDALGFPLDLDTALGIDPNNPTASPFGGLPAGPILPLSLTSLKIKANFAKSGGDGITALGTVDIPDGFKAAGQQFIFYMAGIGRTFKIDGKGHAKSGSDSLIVSLKAKKGVIAKQTAKFSVKLVKGSFASTLAANGFPNTAGATASVSTKVIVLFNTTFLQTIRAVNFTVSKSKIGMAK